MRTPSRENAPALRVPNVAIVVNVINVMNVVFVVIVVIVVKVLKFGILATVGIFLSFNTCRGVGMWIRWERNTRYYEAVLGRDLFGGWVVTKCWGRKNSRLGQVRNVPVSTEGEGHDVIAAIWRRRLRRGYTVVTMDGVSDTSRPGFVPRLGTMARI